MINKIKQRYAITEKGAKGLLKAVTSGIFREFSFLAPAMIVMIFVESVLNNKPKTPMFFVVSILICMICMYVIIYIDYNTTYTETFEESANLRIDIASVLKQLPLSYFSKHDVSDLSQTIMQDVADLEHAMCHSIPQAISFSIFIIFISIMMMIGNIKLALCTLIPIVISFMMLMLSKKMQIRGTSKYYDVLRKNSESFQESIEMQQEIKSYGKAEKIKQELMKKMEESEKIHIETELSQALPTTISTILLKFTLGLTIVFGTFMYINKEVSLIYLIGYIIASSRITDAVNAVYLGLAEIMYIDSRIKRIQNLRNAPTQIGEKINIDTYDIEFKNVKFSYDGQRNVVDNISFVAKQNEVTALVGPSGCGKTSVLRLMSRLYDYDSGQIIIDGKEIDKIDTDSLFEKISIVFQDVTLFDTSIMENIRIGNKNASDEQVIQAAKLSNCHSFIENLPDGYNTLIGENGSKLSGGERQRISIARAFLKNAPIILLDEISASLDVENEMKIQESLNTLIKDKTVIIISHRLKSIENVHKIIVMNNGKIDDMGTHEHLMKNSKLYRSMIEKSNMTNEYTY